MSPLPDYRRPRHQRHRQHAFVEVSGEVKPWLSPVRPPAVGKLATRTTSGRREQWGGSPAAQTRSSPRRGHDDDVAAATSVELRNQVLQSRAENQARYARRFMVFGRETTSQGKVIERSRLRGCALPVKLYRFARIDPTQCRQAAL